MTDTDIENLYKSNVNISHYAGLRAVFDAGYLLGQGVVAATATTTDASTSVTATQAQADDPANVMDPNVAQP